MSDDRYGFLSNDGYPEEGSNPLIKPEPTADYDATLSGRLRFTFHWLAWKIGKALYPPRLVRTRPIPPGSDGAA